MSRLITIVIPVYNRMETLPRTLRSIEMQRVPPAEVILVDNGSTDDSLEIIHAWAEGRDNVKVLKENKRGACAARNRGLSVVHTEYVCFFDSDDEMLPWHLEDFDRAMRNHPEIDIWGRNIVTKKLDGGLRTEYFARQDKMFHHLMRSSLSTGRIMVRTSLVKEVGGWNENLTGWDDYELGVRLLLKSSRLKKISGRPSVIAYQQKESLTGLDFSSHPERWEEALDAIYRQFVFSGRLDLLKWVDVRSMVLAVQYMHEAKYNDAAAPLAKTLKNKILARTRHTFRMKLVYLHNLYFHRLTWVLARMLFPL